MSEADVFFRELCPRFLLLFRKLLNHRSLDNAQHSTSRLRLARIICWKPGKMSADQKGLD